MVISPVGFSKTIIVTTVRKNKILEIETLFILVNAVLYEVYKIFSVQNVSIGC